MVLPYNHVEILLGQLLGLIKSGLEVELCCRCVLFLLKIHQKQIVANRSLLGALDEMWTGLRTEIKQQKDRMGYNLAAMRFLKRQIVDGATVFLGDEASGPSQKKVKTLPPVPQAL